MWYNHSQCNYISYDFLVDIAICEPCMCSSHNNWRNLCGDSLVVQDHGRADGVVDGLHPKMFSIVHPISWVNYNCEWLSITE